MKWYMDIYSTRLGRHITFLEEDRDSKAEHDGGYGVKHEEDKDECGIGVIDNSSWPHGYTEHDCHDEDAD